MVMIKGFLKAVMVILYSSITAVSAAVIVDTGSPALTSNGALSVIPTQWVGIRINLPGSYNITDIKSFFWIPSSSYGTLTASLYSESAGLPGSQLYTQEFSISNSALESPNEGWFGVNGINWVISSGSYWLTYEVRDFQTFIGAVEFPAPSLLPIAIKNDSFIDWTVLSGHGFGLIVEGDLIVSIPEPKTYALLLAGICIIESIQGIQSRSYATWALNGRPGSRQFLSRRLVPQEYSQGSVRITHAHSRYCHESSTVWLRAHSRPAVGVKIDMRQPSTVVAAKQARASFVQ
jgi:hypothetical protein